VQEELRFCVNCSHYRHDPDGSDGLCWNERNLRPIITVSLITGRRLAILPPQEFEIRNLNIMREGSGYCGEKGLWYESKSLSQMVESAKQGEAA